jgi:hypothetical protein
VKLLWLIAQLHKIRKSPSQSNITKAIVDQREKIPSQQNSLGYMVANRYTGTPANATGPPKN